MWKAMICVVFLALVMGLAPSTVWAQENQIVNGEFDDGLNGWGRYGATGFDVEAVKGAGLSGANAASIDVTDAGATDSIGIAQGGLLLEEGKTYPVGFTARADQPREMVLLVQTFHNNANWTDRIFERVELTTTAQTYVFEYTHTADTLGDDAGEGVDLYLMLKGQWWSMEGSDLNAKVWVDRVYLGAEPPLPRRDLAMEPSPEDGAVDVERDGDLSWTPGVFAQTHDVYLGTAFEDVNDASRATPGEVLASEGQAGATYDPGRLEFGTTYYWRIDEVNGAPDNAIIRGDVWSFTTEPLAYQVANVTATSNVTSNAGEGPENTVNGSGLDADDLHSTASSDMWIVSGGAADPVWIQYEFDQVYKLHEMLVWNYNVEFELLLGFGIKNVTVEYSANGTDWTALGDVELARATAQPDYAANTTIDLQGVAAQFVKLTVNSGYGTLPVPQYGLSEARFLYIPAHARQPEPADGATAISVAAALSWRAGRDAASHEVSLSTDEAAVVEGTALVDAVAESRYAPDNLEFGSTYFWKVDEVNEAEAVPSWQGAVWSFSTKEYAVIDDFEGYTDDTDAGEAIWQTWVDGYEIDENGSQVGYIEAPFSESSVVNSGSWSMPLSYDNTGLANVSEATRDLGGQSWNTNGADTLVVNYRGSAPAFFETDDGRILMNSIGADVWGTADQFRYAYMRLNGDGSIIARVDDVANTSGWAKAGVMIREGLDAGSAHAMVVVTPANGVALQYRPIMNQDTLGINEGGLAAPYWVKLTRSGNMFTAERSADGVTWGSITDDAAASTVEIEMDANVYIGLMSGSVNANTVGGATFSNIVTTDNVTGSWETTGIGIEQPAGNAPAPLYVAVEDNAGHKAVVVHPDSLAAAATGWRQWLISLSDLSGVNLNSVKTLTIGVGDADDSAGGAGLLYIDDIGFGRPAAE